MLKNPPIFSIGFFTPARDSQHLVAEISDLNARCGKGQPLFPFKVASADEPIAEFNLTNILYDGEGDIILWELGSLSSNRKITLLND
jgi:hypothetical protein